MNTNEIIELSKATSKTTSFAQLLKMVEKELGENATLELNFDIALSADCTYCQDKTLVLKPVGLYFQEHLICEKCGNERNLNTFHLINRKQAEVFGLIKNLKLADLNIPPLDILQGWSKDGKGLAFELSGDKKMLF
jgi:hypothetical protein